MGRPPESPERRQERQDAFLEAFAKTGIISSACEAANIHAPRHYLWLKEDESYASRFDEIKSQTAEITKQNRKKPGVKKGYRHTGERGQKRSENQQKFLDSLSSIGVLSEAAKDSDIPIGTHNFWYKEDEDYRIRVDSVLKFTENLRKQHTSDRLSKASKAGWDNPERRERAKSNSTLIWTAERRSEAGRQARERMSDPIYKERWLEINRQRRSTPEAKEMYASHSVYMKNLWQDPEYQAKHRAKMNSPEVREKLRANAQKQWEGVSPEERRKKMSAMRRVFKGGHRLTKIEAQVMVALNDRELPYFVHKLIDGYVADLLIPSLKLVVECDGSWHHPQREDTDRQRDTTLADLGFRTLRLSEEEIKNKNWSRLDEEIKQLSCG